MVTAISGQLTVTIAVAELFVSVVEASLVAVAEAVFATVPQLAEDVVAFTCTLELPAAARLVGV